MIAAKREYNYYPEEEKRQVKKRKVVKSKPKSTKATGNLKLFILFITIVSTASIMVLLTRYARITAINTEINNLERTYGELEKEKINLNAEIDSLKTSENIMGDAMMKLGMGFPEDGQVLYVDVKNRVGEKVDGNLILKLKSIVKGMF